MKIANETINLAHILFETKNNIKDPSGTLESVVWIIKAGTIFLV